MSAFSIADATPEQVADYEAYLARHGLLRVQARLELRRSNAAVPHRNRRREAKRPGKGNRGNWKKEEQ